MTLPVFKQIKQKSFEVKIVLWLCFWLLGTGLLLPNDICAREGEEYAVKAAFVLNFAKVTRWPDDAFGDTSETIDLCLVGDKQLVEHFKSIDGKQVGERTLRLHHKYETEDCRECEILFVGNDVDRAAQLRFFAAAKDRPVLIIGEMSGFARIGGIINFTSKKGRLHFEINPKEAERKGIKISSRILQLATIVVSD